MMTLLGFKVPRQVLQYASLKKKKKNTEPTLTFYPCENVSAEVH